jgi:hypothetical protein
VLAWMRILRVGARSKCRGVRTRPAGLWLTPRPNDPRGSHRNGGSSETRPRVKLD